MKILKKSELDYILNLPLVAGSPLEIGKEYVRIHDDCGGKIDQHLKIILTEDTQGDIAFNLYTPTETELRFRNYGGGGASLRVHNALKILTYAIVKKSIGPTDTDTDIGIETEITQMNNQALTDVLEGLIILPPEVFEDSTGRPSYFFEILPQLSVVISTDGDMHIITRPTTILENQIRTETTYWNSEPCTLCLKTNCSRAVYNAMILLTHAIVLDNQNRPFC